MRRLIVAFLLLLSSAHLVGQTVEPFSGQLVANGGVTVDRLGNVYVGNFGNNSADGTTVFKITPDGQSSVFAVGILGASGNAFDSQGNLYQANFAGGLISKITPDGTVTTFAAANIDSPVGVAVDRDDHVYTTNCRNPGSLTRITPDGTATRFVTDALMNCPNGLALDREGNLYTANFNNGLIIKVTPDGQASIFANVPGGNNGHLVFANERFYVVGRGFHRIYEVSLSGEVTLLAGSGARGLDNGPALQASFSLPNGIGVSPDGNTLFINDVVPLQGNVLNPVIVRKITGIKGVQPQLEFPQFGNGDVLTSEIVLVNPSDSETREGDLLFWRPDGAGIDAFSILGEVFGPDGQELGNWFTIPPRGSITFRTTGQGETVSGSVRVDADGPLSGVIRFSLEGAGIAGVPSSPPLTAATAPARLADGVRTGVAVRNVGQDAIDVTMTLRDLNGVDLPGASIVLNLPPQGRESRFIDEFFSGSVSDGFRGSVHISSANGEFAAIALELGTRAGEFTTLPVTPSLP